MKGALIFGLLAAVIAGVAMVATLYGHHIGNAWLIALGAAGAAGWSGSSSASRALPDARRLTADPLRPAVYAVSSVVSVAEQHADLLEPGRDGQGGLGREGREVVTRQLFRGAETAGRGVEMRQHCAGKLRLGGDRTVRKHVGDLDLRHSGVPFGGGRLRIT